MSDPLLPAHNAKIKHLVFLLVLEVILLKGLRLLANCIRLSQTLTNTLGFWTQHLSATFVEFVENVILTRAFHIYLAEILGSPGERRGLGVFILVLSETGEHGGSTLFLNN